MTTKREYLMVEKRIASLTEAMKRIGFKLEAVRESHHFSWTVSYRWIGREHPGYGKPCHATWRIGATIALTPDEARLPLRSGKHTVRLEASAYSSRGIGMLKRAEHAIAVKTEKAGRTLRDWKRADAKARQ